MAGFFGLLNYEKPDKGVSKNEAKKTGVELYIDIFIKRFWKLLTLNIIYIISSIPALIVNWFLSLYFFGLLVSMAKINITSINSLTIYLLMAIMSFLLLFICGSGPSTIAFNYVIRKYVNDEHAWVWDDFKEVYKSNFKYGVAIWVVNTIIISITLFSFLFYSYSKKNTSFVMLRYIVFIIIELFIMMQLYIYQLPTITKSKIKNLYQNSFLLTAIKFLRNIIITLISVIIIYGVVLTFINIPLAGLLLFLLITYSVVTFTQIFMTNNVIKKYILENSDETA